MINYFAKNCIWLSWKQNAPPTFKLFLVQLSQFLTLEKLSLERQNCGLIFKISGPLFFHIWKGFSYEDL